MTSRKEEEGQKPAALIKKVCEGSVDSNQVGYACTRRIMVYTLFFFFYCSYPIFVVHTLREDVLALLASALFVAGSR